MDHLSSYDWRYNTSVTLYPEDFKPYSFWKITSSRPDSLHVSNSKRTNKSVVVHAAGTTPNGDALLNIKCYDRNGKMLFDKTVDVNVWYSW